MYQAGRYSEALPVFQLLEVLKDDDERFSLGIAKCYEAQEEWELAILKYLGLTKFHPDPYLIWNAYLCAEKLKNQQFTMAILGMLYSETIDLPEYEELNEKAETLMIKKAEKMAEETVKEQG
jgi:tetratricopeptide (TPR) repeat protein